jgi:Holliday junction resolvase RusA-like endonuclease
MRKLATSGLNKPHKESLTMRFPIMIGFQSKIIRLVPQPRPRVLKRGAAYMDRDYVKCRDGLGLAMRCARPRGWPLDASYALSVSAFCPKSTAGDVDKLLATVMDAGNGVLWQDDRQVTSSLINKTKGRAGVNVQVTVLDPTGFEPKPKARRGRARSASRQEP